MKNLLFRLAEAYRRLMSLLLRASGRTPQEFHHARIVSGRAWGEFCDALKAAGVAISMPGTQKDELNQSEGYRYLTRLLRGGLEAFLEFGDPAYPELRRTVHETVKIGADNPDNAYYNAAVSGEYSYLITGNRGTVSRLSLHMQRGDYGSSGGLKPAGKLVADDLTVNADGDFSVLASVSRPEDGKTDWLPMTEDTTMFMVRQTFGNREEESPAVVRIQRVDADGPPRAIDAEFVDRALSRASLFVAGTATVFTRWSLGFNKHVNSLPQFDPGVSTNAGGDPDIVYYHSSWKLRRGQVLVIETPIPECEFWNFQLNNFWMESLDYRYHRIHINGATASLNPNGTVTIVVSEDDPGHPNWLSTAGHKRGTMCFRWIRPADAPPQPGCRVMGIDDVEGLSTGSAS